MLPDLIVNTDYLPDLIDNDIPYLLPTVRVAIVKGVYARELQRLNIPYN